MLRSPDTTECFGSLAARECVGNPISVNVLLVLPGVVLVVLPGKVLVVLPGSVLVILVPGSVLVVLVPGSVLVS